MSFSDFPNLSTAIRTEDVVGLQICGEEEGYVLRVYMRGSNEPITLYSSDQSSLTFVYNSIKSQISEEAE